MEPWIWEKYISIANNKVLMPNNSEHMIKYAYSKRLNCSPGSDNFYWKIQTRQGNPVKGKLLFNSIEQLDALVLNLKCGHWFFITVNVSYFGKYFDLQVPDIQTIYFSTLVLFHTKKPNLNCGHCNQYWCFVISWSWTTVIWIFN